MGALLPSLEAVSCNRTVIAKERSMGADFESTIIHFKDMKLASIQAKWSGNDAFDGELIVEASDVPEDEWFDEIEGGYYKLEDDGSARRKRKTKLFNLGQVGYLYARVVYLKGANTTGTITIIATGKK